MNPYRLSLISLSTSDYAFYYIFILKITSENREKRNISKIRNANIRRSTHSDEALAIEFRFIAKRKIHFA